MKKLVKANLMMFTNEVCRQFVNIFTEYYEKDGKIINDKLRLFNKDYDNSYLDPNCNNLPYDTYSTEYYNEMNIMCGVVALYSSLISYLYFLNNHIHENKILDKLYPNKLQNPFKSSKDIITVLRSIFETMYITNFYLDEINKGSERYHDEMWDKLNDIFVKTIMNPKYSLSKEYIIKHRKILKVYESGIASKECSVMWYKLRMLIKYTFSSEVSLRNWFIKSLDGNYDPSRKHFGDKFTNVLKIIRASAESINSPIIKDFFYELVEYVPSTDNTDPYADPKYIEKSSDNIIKIVSTTAEGISYIRHILTVLLAEQKVNKACQDNNLRF